MPGDRGQSDCREYTVRRHSLLGKNGSWRMAKKFFFTILECEMCMCGGGMGGENNKYFK